MLMHLCHIRIYSNGIVRGTHAQASTGEAGRSGLLEARVHVESRGRAFFATASKTRTGDVGRVLGDGHEDLGHRRVGHIPVTGCLTPPQPRVAERWRQVVPWVRWVVVDCAVACSDPDITLLSYDYHIIIILLSYYYHTRLDRTAAR
jgi:hypothetical protein